MKIIELESKNRRLPVLAEFEEIPRFRDIGVIVAFRKTIRRRRVVIFKEIWNIVSATGEIQRRRWEF